MKICSGLDSSEFIEAIPDFHKLSFRVNQLNDSIKNDKADRYNGVKILLNFTRKGKKIYWELKN